MKEELGYICPQTKKQCDDECCVSAEDCHAEAINSIISNCEPEQLNQNKMKSKLKILVIFVVMFFASFVPESNHEIFGDWKCKGGKIEFKNDDMLREGCRYYDNSHGPSWHWGMRHWIWLFTGITFSIWTIVDVIVEESKKTRTK